VTEKSEKEAQLLQEQYARICDTLIDTLVDGRAATGFVSELLLFSFFDCTDVLSERVVLRQSCADLCRRKTVNHFQHESSESATLS
jgi:hypothetical protein